MRYKLFGNSGLRVSEICLGTMGFGKDWDWGADHSTSKKIFDYYAEQGGNFLDTANVYQLGTSERFLGEFINSDRDHFVLATKFTLMDREDINFAGNHIKNLRRSVEGSLKRLGTDYIDLLWLHMWDSTTPVEEVMRGLENLVSSGKVNYIGISDTPAWVVSQSNMLAEMRGWPQFIGLQIEYSLMERTPERDLIPMANHWGMTLTPWAPIAGGVLTGKYLNDPKAGRISDESPRRAENNRPIVELVVEMAKEKDITPAQLAIAWTIQNPGVSSIPIVGATKLEQLKDSLGAIDVRISNDEMEKLNAASEIELGFPHEFLKKDIPEKLTFGGQRELLDI